MSEREASLFEKPFRDAVNTDARAAALRPADLTSLTGRDVDQLVDPANDNAACEGGVGFW